MKIWLIVLTSMYKKYITCILNLFLSEQLTINKYTLLDCTNTQIRMYCTVHNFGTVTLHTLFWYRHTHMTFQPPDCHLPDSPQYPLKLYLITNVGDIIVYLESAQFRKYS